MDRRLWREPLDDRIVHEDLILDSGATLRIRDGAGLLVFVRMGRIWITQQRDSRDIVLDEGEWFRLDRKGLAIIHAFRGSSITITAPLDARPHWTIERDGVTLAAA